MLGALLWSVRRDLRCAPRLRWLALAVVGTVGATVLRSATSPLVAALLAIAAWACGLLAFLPDVRRGAMRVAGGVLWPGRRHDIATLPVLGLAVLALPQSVDVARFDILPTHQAGATGAAKKES